MKFNLHAAVSRLTRGNIQSIRDSRYAFEQAVCQFNGLLEASIREYPGNFDIVSLKKFTATSITPIEDFQDSIERLNDALSAIPEIISEGALQFHQKFGILRQAPQQLKKDFAEYESDLSGLGIVFIDIDHFKKLNSKYTETLVDKEILVPYMRFLSDSVQSRGFAYSVGGDEFIILLRNVGPNEASAFANRLLEMTRRNFLFVKGDKVTLTLSIGVASFKRDANNFDGLIKCANEAENQAKKQGGNRVEIFSSSFVC